jgi:hypothetical protein
MIVVGCGGSSDYALALLMACCVAELSCGGAKTRSREFA